MLTELWVPGLLGYLSHSRKLTAARRETSMIGHELTLPFVPFKFSDLFILPLFAYPEKKL